MAGCRRCRGDLDVRASLQGLLVIEDDRLPARRLPWSERAVPRYFLPYRGLVGLAIIAVFWPSSALEVEPLARHSFFPLWLGYILIVDGLVLRRTGSSLINRSPLAFLGMFVIAVPYWWSFEWINQVTGNWEYVGPDDYPWAVRILQSSCHYSVVIPAVLQSAELVGSLGFIRRFARGPRLALSRRQLYAAVGLGFLCLAVLLVWPKQFFPLTWVFLFLVLDPVNHLRGRPSLFAQVRHGDWRTVAAVALGALLTGWFWEMWNNASVSWTYEIAFFDFVQIFEMPLLGFGGYLPFGLETYAFYHFTVHLLRWPSGGEMPVYGDAR